MVTALSKATPGTREGFQWSSEWAQQRNRRRGEQLRSAHKKGMLPRNQNPNSRRKSREGKSREATYKAHHITILSTLNHFWKNPLEKQEIIENLAWRGRLHHGRHARMAEDHGPEIGRLGRNKTVDICFWQFILPKPQWERHFEHFNCSQWIFTGNCREQSKWRQKQILHEWGRWQISEGSWKSQVPY